jgi:hypothetical protein
MEQAPFRPSLIPFSCSQTLIRPYHSICNDVYLLHNYYPHSYQVTHDLETDKALSHCQEGELVIFGSFGQVLSSHSSAGLGLPHATSSLFFFVPAEPCTHPGPHAPGETSWEVSAASLNLNHPGLKAHQMLCSVSQAFAI